jgi:sugar lactone lactonase YvrE
LIALAALGSLALGAAAAPRPSRYILPGDTVFPEGIAFQQGTHNFYVSSNQDGTIFRGDTRREMTTIFLPGGSDGRTTATGMKVDDEGRLFIAGASSGKIFVYDTATGALLGQFYDGKTMTFLNDIAITGTGDAYVTDSLDPTLYKVSIDGQGHPQFEAWLDFTGTPFVYQPGFNANGIVASPDGKYLVIVQSNTGKLFRVDIATKEVTEVNLGGATVTNGDGLLLQGRTLYVVQNAQGVITEVQLTGDLSGGRVVSSSGDPSLRFPTTVAKADGRLLVVNSQFDKRGPGLHPELPFTVSSIRTP